jgi:hypothetical protein
MKTRPNANNAKDEAYSSTTSEFLFVLNHEKNLCAQRESIPTVRKPVMAVTAVSATV